MGRKGLSLPEKLLLCAAALSLSAAVLFINISGSALGERVLSASPRESFGKARTGKAVDINSASAQELETLPGIGPSLAETIVQYREKHGPFPYADAIMDVAGIGEARFDALETYITAVKG